MNKKEFINYFESKDKDALASLYEKINIADKVTYPLYTTEFYPPSVWSVLSNISTFKNVNITFLGGFKESERKIIAFNHEEYYERPFKILNIKCKSKFNVLSHRDFLGAIMSLGIKREKFGDVMVDGNEAFVVVNKEISEYMMSNLKSISNVPCSIEEINDDKLIPQVKFQDLNIISTSLRIDCLVSAITNLSRGNSEKIVKEGKVLVNYIEVNEKSKEININDVLTIRGYGKFKIYSIVGITSKGRIKLNIKKYS